MEGKKVIEFRHPGLERRRVAIFLAVLAVLALILAFFFVDQGRNWDRVHRFFAYGSQDVEILTDTAPGVLADLEGKLVTAGFDGVSLFDKNGKELFVTAATLNHPVLQTGSGKILAYDAGGTTMLLLDEAGRNQLTEPLSGAIFDADLASDGSLAYITASSREKSRLVVLDPNQKCLLTLNSTTRYLMACTVAPGADYACAIALGEAEGVFQSTAAIYRTDRKEPLAEVDLGSQVIYDVEFWGDDWICALGQEELLVFDLHGTISGRYPTSNVVDYDLQGDGFAALVVPVGAGRDLVTVDHKGRELSRMALDMSPEVDVNGKYVAVLTSTGLTISGRKLERWAYTEDVAGVNAICVNPDGTAYLADASGVRRYLP